MRESMNEVTGMQNENLLQDSVKSTVETAMGVSAGQVEPAPKSRTRSYHLETTPGGRKLPDISHIKPASTEREAEYE